MIATLIIIAAACLCLYAGYQMRKFDEQLEDIFKDCFNLKDNEK